MNLPTILLIAGCLICTSCIDQQRGLMHKEGYRYISGQTVKSDQNGKLKEAPKWLPTHHMTGEEADSMLIHGDFDSIFVKIPVTAGGIPKMYRKILLKPDSWKPRPAYGALKFAGVYSTEALPGFFIAFYFTENRSAVLRVEYTSPGFLVGATLFSKDSTNFLKEGGIFILPEALNRT
ncbi:hypothetical protein [Filimonas effusa]|uniref:Uncharacterized protein n=1 Tax=Filimonas effusa TaxID=2508721 RepID=A0A4Q1D5C5_9BACT|nr:hypothetical protein [Filimonas effusa]RXK83685.1 hypothetical protein ESB13_16525 [Filimonas effusa]